MRILNLQEVYNQVDQARAAEDRHVAADQQRQLTQFTIDEQKVIREAAAQSVGQDGEYDPDLHEQALNARGRGDLGRKLRMELAAEAAKISDWINTSLPYVNESNYPRIRQIAAQAGIELPEQYNKEQLDAIAQQVLARTNRFSKYGEAQQIPHAQKGVVGQKNLDTGEYKVLDSTISFGRGGYGGGGAGTGRERIIDRIMSELGVGFEIALELERRSQSMDPEKFYRDVALASLNKYETPERAQERALQLTKALYPTWIPGETTGPRVNPQPPPAQPAPKRPVYDPMGILNQK